MGIFSFLLAGPAPTCPPPKKSLRRYFKQTYSLPESYIVIDLETSGLDACTYEILEIGAIRYQDHKRVASYHTFCKPEGFIPKAASDINHITWPKVCNAPSFDAVFSSFLDFIGNDVLIGYNIGFDIKFLQTRSQTDIKNYAFDVLPFVRQMIPGKTNYTLDSLRQTLYLGGNAHSALGDCETTARVYQLGLKSPELPNFEAEHAIQEEALRISEERERKREELRKKREQAKEKLPSQKELHKISSLMTGSSDEYIERVKSILVNNYHADISKLERPSNHLLYLNNTPLFGVKLDGLLRYVFINAPIETLACRFVSAPTTFSECEDGVRVYLAAPSDLCEISELIYHAYLNCLRQEPDYCFEAKP